MPFKHRLFHRVPCACPDGIERRATAYYDPTQRAETRGRITVRHLDGALAIAGTLRPINAAPGFRFIPTGKNARFFREKTQ